MKLKHTKFQRIIESVTVLTLVFMFIYLIAMWRNIPDKVPGHYNAAGVVDRWGNRGELLIVPIISLVLYILLTVVTCFPSIWGVPEKSTDEEQKSVYINTKSMLIVLKMELVMIFLYIMIASLKTQALGSWFLPVLLITIFGTLTFFIVRMYRSK